MCLLKIHLGLVPFLRLLDVFGGQILILQADIPQSSRQVRFSHLHIHLHVLLLMHLVLQLQHFLQGKDLYFLLYRQSPPQKKPHCDKFILLHCTCARLLQCEKRQFKLSVVTIYSGNVDIFKKWEPYLFMQLLEEVYFLLK